jgi:Txe/YoeB family toxin of Txe-Axe toxin-antitoxin module
MSDNKYKLFRNFMVNELGIGQEEIREWTMESVKETIEKIMRERRWEDYINDVVKSLFRNDYENRQAVERAVSDYLYNSFRINIEKREGDKA